MTEGEPSISRLGKIKSVCDCQERYGTAELQTWDGG